MNCIIKRIFYVYNIYNIYFYKNYVDILYCDKIDELVNVEIQYRADGDYKPSFENSIEIDI